MSNIIVTGGLGFIGSHVCDILLARGYNVIAIDNLDNYYDPQQKYNNLVEVSGKTQKFKFLRGDITNPLCMDTVVERYKPEYIIHEAAQAGVRASLVDPFKTFNTNLQSTLAVLESARKHDVAKVVFASSSSVYGGGKLPFCESSPTYPISPYGVSKLACEQLFYTYNKLYGLDYVGLRYFTVYGPRIRPDLAIYKFTKACLEGRPIEVYGDGSKKRDFTYVFDAALATVNALQKGQGIYNIGGGSVLTVKELAENIIKTIGKGEIKYVADQKGDMDETWSDCTKAMKELDYKPHYNIADNISLPKTIKWVVEAVNESKRSQKEIWGKNVESHEQNGTVKGDNSKDNTRRVRHTRKRLGHGIQGSSTRSRKHK